MKKISTVLALTVLILTFYSGLFAQSKQPALSSKDSVLVDSLVRYFESLQPEQINQDQQNTIPNSMETKFDLLEAKMNRELGRIDATLDSNSDDDNPYILISTLILSLLCVMLGIFGLLGYKSVIRRIELLEKFDK